MLHQHPFIRITACYIVGLLVGYVFPNGWIAAVCLCCACIISSLQLFNKYRYAHWLSGFGLCLALCGMGILGWITYPNPYHKTLPAPGTYHGVALQDAVEKPKTYQCITHLTDTAGNQYKSILYIAKDSVSATLQEGTQFYVTLQKVQPQTFAYYNKQHIYSRAYVPHNQWHLVAQPTHLGLKHYARHTKNHLLGTLKQHTDSTGYALTSAITLGHKASLKGTTKQYFSAAGISHILAVSGLHVGIIYMVISLLLKPLASAKWAQKVGQVVLILLLWGYAFLCGLPPSIVRAVIMFSVGAVGVIFHQTNQSINTVFFTAFAMLVYNPNYLFDMGFQLSFCAVLGILLFYPPLYKIMEFKVVAGKGNYTKLKHLKLALLKWIWGTLCVSLAAQLSTLPLILYYFGTFPTYFLLTNVVVVPLGTLLVYACLLLFMVSPIGIGHWLEMPIDVLVTLLQRITKGISQLPYAQINSLHTTLFQSLCMATLLLFGYYFCLKPIPKRLFCILCTLIVWLSVEVLALGIQTWELGVGS